MRSVEITLAVVSGVCGLAVVAYTFAGMPRQAAVAGGVGLFLCNAIWLMRLS